MKEPRTIIYGKDYQGDCKWDMSVRDGNMRIGLISERPLRFIRISGPRMDIMNTELEDYIQSYILDQLNIPCEFKVRANRWRDGYHFHIYSYDTTIQRLGFLFNSGEITL
jgi:hypothetical protein